jgi:hypothetical protein
MKICPRCKKDKLITDFCKDKARKSGRYPICKSCINKAHDPKKHAEYRQRVRQQKPWLSHYHNAKSRCEYKKDINYKNYGGRGIKLLMTENDFKFLWFRDKAYLLKKPSIDRIKKNKHYEISNCRFIEGSYNSQLAVEKPIEQYSLSCKLIKIFRSAKEAGEILSICRPNICKVLKGVRKSTGGFVFKYSRED